MSVLWGPLHVRQDDNLSPAAKYQRLRRLCEKKTSGKLQVPEETHELWKNGGVDRDNLMLLLQRCNWEKAEICEVKLELSFDRRMC